MKTKHYLLTTLLCAFFAFAAQAQGVMEFEKTTHDFGEVTEGDFAEHTFTFKNTGDAPIIMSNVRASCGCTTPEWSKEPVAPGETGFVKARYNSKGRPGNFNKSITITSNAKTPTTQLRIQGVVKRDPAMEPIGEVAKKEIQLGKVAKKEQARFEVALKNVGKSDLMVYNIRSVCGQCVKRDGYTPRIRPGAEEKLGLIFTAADNMEEGPFEYTVHIRTNNSQNPAVEVKIKGEIVASLGGNSMMRESENASPFGK